MFDILEEVGQVGGGLEVDFAIVRRVHCRTVRCLQSMRRRDKPLIATNIGDTALDDRCDRSLGKDGGQCLGTIAKLCVYFILAR